MAEPGEQEVSGGGQICIGKVEVDPKNPEVRTGSVLLRITIGPDGLVYASPQAAIEGREAYQENVRGS